MEKKKRIKRMISIGTAFIFLWAILGLIHAFHVISLPKTAVIVLDGLAICVIIGLYCLNLKKLSDEFRFIGLFQQQKKNR